MFNGALIDQLSEANKASGKLMSPDVGWKPTLYGQSSVLPASPVIGYVLENAGAGKL